MIFFIRWTERNSGEPPPRAPLPKLHSGPSPVTAGPDQGEEQRRAGGAGGRGRLHGRALRGDERVVGTAVDEDQGRPVSEINNFTHTVIHCRMPTIDAHAFKCLNDSHEMKKVLDVTMWHRRMRMGQGHITPPPPPKKKYESLKALFNSVSTCKIIWCTWPYMLSLSLIRSKNEALKKCTSKAPN